MKVGDLVRDRRGSLGIILSITRRKLIEGRIPQAVYEVAWYYEPHFSQMFKVRIMWNVEALIKEDKWEIVSSAN
jgi:hypothetical protein